ncbi:penicillin-binding transpeptidase domain-containing protein [Paenibacillus sp. NEAU-GSW1]|uniref:penicillin-binding transpeptidase domain-containing protein n=1 Tax=Paenibacillus sp. NEAU-GSW1 TaxID=2682486 RepID=UPI0012E182F7|nr:penicillin-binding transpeptidase domain-containing protein [Paenibacillus sp. NEAU-GSW1]MUT66197.1 PASTA domain-containing protein [Paenibacillus sp. NEAU-GSW1]
MIKRIRLRTLLLGGIMTLLFLVLFGRIYWVQIVKGDYWYGLAKTRWSAEETLIAKRGTITDRDGNVLAMDSLAYTVAVNPKMIDGLGIADEVTEGLHELLGKPEDEVRKLVTAKKEETGEFFQQREIQREGWKIDKELADKIKAFRDELEKKHDVKDAGIYLIDDQKRYYPRGTMASQLLGYVTKEGKAMTGIESFFDDKLRGENGEIIYEKDGKRVQLSKGEVNYTPAKDGQDITLTIDMQVQNYVEEALKEIVKEYNPKTVTAIAADPNTMEILAMAHMPTYNPNTYWQSDYENAYNHSIKSLYEPGSTFKIVTLAAAVEEGIFNPNAEYKSGRINVPGRPVNDINKVGWGTISYLAGLKHSSNVAFVKLGWEQLGGPKLLDYINRFGFGQKTGIQLGGESAGKINVNLSIPSDIARVSFGQGPVQVTAIQQVAAVAAVANGGKLLQPQIVKQIYDPMTKTTQTFKPQLVRQVISEETSRKVGEYLEQVVSDQEIGTGKNAYIEGYRVAGKTGTAQKVINGEYSKTKFVVSFIGYAPVENPKIVLYIVVDEPNDSLAGGGKVAAPAFKEIVSKALRHYGIAPSSDPNKDAASKKEASVTVPDMTNIKVSQAKAELTEKKLSFEIVGNGTSVLKQIPASGTAIHPSQRIYLITEQKDKLKIPDMTGLSLRDAMEISSVLDVRLIVEGEGYVVSQKEEQKDGSRYIRLKLEPPLGSDAALESGAAEDEGADASSEAKEDSSAAAENGAEGEAAGNG